MCRPTHCVLGWAMRRRPARLVNGRPALWLVDGLVGLRAAPSRVPRIVGRSPHDFDSSTHSSEILAFQPSSPKRNVGSTKLPNLNLEIGRYPTGEIIILEIPKCYSLYNSPHKLEKCLNRFDRIDNYIYRAPRPKERLPGSDPYEIAVYKDIMNGGLRFPIHPFFVSIFNEFHLTPS